VRPLRTYGSAQGYEGLNPLPSSEFANPTCPECRDEMVSRRNRATGVAFWGCRNYPACKSTLPDPIDASKASYLSAEARQGHLSEKTPKNRSLRNTV
jgi:ssDNA-binding Zn-finger/Zn-ribbon topoisomerase 1